MSKQTDLQTARVQRIMATLHVAEPSKVVRFDADAMTADVQPLVMREIDGVMATAPQLVAVPVLTLCAADWYIRPWYKPGDVGLLIYCDQDIDTALAGEVAEPGTNRQHSMSDAVFVGGLWLKGNVPDGLPDDALVIGTGSQRVEITRSVISITGTLRLNGVNLGSHTHTAPEGGGTTSGPQ